MPLVILAAALVVALLMAEGTASAIRDRKTFLETVRPIARRIEAETGVKASVAMAQWAHESGYGSGSIFRATNNLGSITAQSWSARDAAGRWSPRPGYESRVYVSATREWVGGKEVIQTRPFRRYPDLVTAARDWARLITEVEVYKKSGAPAAARSGDLLAFGAAMNRAGYATDPAYGEKLQKFAGLA